MTKQEEIREVLITMCCKAKAKDLSKSSTGFTGEVDDAMVELQGLGVVIKVERELPDLNLPTLTGNLSLEITMKSFAKKIRNDMLEAGYVAVEPLLTLK